MQKQEEAAEQRHQDAGSLGTRVVRGAALTALVIALILTAIALWMRVSGYYDLAMASLPVAVGGGLLGLCAIWALMARSSIILRVTMTVVVCVFLILFVRSRDDVGNRMIFESMTLTMENMKTIGLGIESYRNDHDGAYPYDSRGPLESLALLYPKYVRDPRVFTSSGISRHWFRRDIGPRFPEGTSLAGAPCHYDYTWPMSKNAGEMQMVACTIPECYFVSSGAVVLYADGHVAWESRVGYAGN